MSMLFENHTNDVSGMIDSMLQTELKRSEYAKRTGDAPIAIANELRYAGRHLADAIEHELKSDQACEITENLHKAQRHAKRAEYDLLEYELAVYEQEAQAILNSIKGYEHIAHSVLPDFSNYMKARKKQMRYLEEVHEFDKNSAQYKERSQSHLTATRQFIEKFESRRHKIFTAIEKSQKKRRRKACIELAVFLIALAYNTWLLLR